MWKDSETELDFLDYDYLVQSMIEIIKDDSLLPACIGLYGDWGSGKSSLIRMCKSQLEKEDDKIKCLIFNGWLFENYDDAKTAILGEILDGFKEEAKLSDKARRAFKALYKSIDKLKIAKSTLKFGLDFFLTGGIGTLADLTIKKVVESASGKLPNVELDNVEKAIKDELDYKELREDIREFQKKFAELLEESKISRLVVFIDELDRCRPDTILDTLEAIKLFLFTGKAAFVLGADERHIAYAVRSKFKDIEGQEIDIGKEYLEKLVQYPVKIPRLDSKEVETYIGCLLLQSDLDDVSFNRLIEAFHKSQNEDFTTASLTKVATEIGVETKDTLTTAHQLSNLLAHGLNGNRIKTMNESIYYNIDKIHAGISADKRIAFQYFEYTVDKKRCFRHDGAEYSISPYALTWDNENYYMIGYDDQAQKIKHYRVDKMVSIDVTDLDRLGKEEFNKFDMAVYSKKIFGMYGGKEERITLRFANHLAGVVIDRFGKDVFISKIDTEHFTIDVNVQVSPQFLAWVFGLGEDVKILEPQGVQEQFLNTLENIIKLYCEGEN